MAFRRLTDAECGQGNSLVHLTSHLTRDHAFSELHGQPIANSSDQFVEEFLQEARAAPQTFQMDNLIREMHDIESHNAALPPVPATLVKGHFNEEGIWAQEYVENNQDHQAIWDEIAAQSSKDQVGVPWVEEFMQGNHRPTEEDIEHIKSVENAINNHESLDHAWSEEYQSNFYENLASSWLKEHEEDAPIDAEAKGDFWKRFENEYKKAWEDQEHGDSWVSEYSEYYDPYKEYKYTEENPMFDIINPLERGKEMLAQGDLPSAVLCFEAAVKKTPENAEAWELLGTTQAENEQDPNAICALKRCVELQPNNLSALMALAVSYTNENYYRQACQALINWLKQNPEYSHFVPTTIDNIISGQVSSIINPNEQREIEDIFIRAAQQRPQNVDHEVQCALGILFNISHEYDKAVDCFRAALSVKPNDARLWNRLGATLANSSKSDEAVEAYHQALNLQPGFIRARYNVGITCINLSSYKEAAEHFLIALNAQARGKDTHNNPGLTQMSDSIWNTLRMCISLMNRSDLRPAVDQRNLELLSKEFGLHEN